MNGTLPNIFSVDDIKIIQLIYFPEERGNLVVMENYKSCPFAISRAFSVRAPINMIRGQHAHKDCAQFLVCLNGEVEVTCDDGIEKKFAALCLIAYSAVYLSKTNAALIPFLLFAQIFIP